MCYLNKKRLNNYKHLLQIPTQPNGGKVAPAEFENDGVAAAENIKHADRMVAANAVVLHVLRFQVLLDVHGKLEQRVVGGVTWRGTRRM